MKSKGGLGDGLSGLRFVDANGQVDYNALAGALNSIDSNGLMIGVAAWRDSGCTRPELVYPGLERAEAQLAQRGPIPPHDKGRLLRELMDSFL